MPMAAASGFWRRADTVTLEVFGTYPAQSKRAARRHPRGHHGETSRLDLERIRMSTRLATAAA